MTSSQQNDTCVHIVLPGTLRNSSRPCFKTCFQDVIYKFLKQGPDDTENNQVQNILVTLPVFLITCSSFIGIYIYAVWYINVWEKEKSWIQGLLDISMCIIWLKITSTFIFHCINLMDETHLTSNTNQ